MTILVADESGVDPAEANSYASETEADAYFDDRFNLDWSVVPDKEAALIKATAYIDARYRGLWRGVRATETQALAWPRSDVLDEDGYEVSETIIPKAIKYAVFEAAVRSNSAELFTDWTTTSDVKKQRDKVGEIETETEYADPHRGDQPVYAIIDALLSGLTTGSAGGPSTAFVMRA